MTYSLCTANDLLALQQHACVILCRPNWSQQPHTARATLFLKKPTITPECRNTLTTLNLFRNQHTPLRPLFCITSLHHTSVTLRGHRYKMPFTWRSRQNGGGMAYRARCTCSACAAWPAAGPFHRAYPHATQQAFLEAHELAFAFFGGTKVAYSLGNASFVAGSPICSMTFLASVRSCLSGSLDATARSAGPRAFGAFLGIDGI
jgi:hypothetical protein